MANMGKTIQIFLPFGSPRGIKIAEITNRTVQAIYIPRNELERAALREEIKNVGVYYLFGKDEDDAKTQVYIGEAENVYERLKQHNREKDFWEVAIAVVTNNLQNQFTKTDVKYLELYSYEKAMTIRRYKINQTKPASSFVPEWRKCDLMDIFETIKILLSTLGYPLFDELRSISEDRKINQEEIFYCKGRGGRAKGQFSEEGFIIFKGSIMTKDVTNSFPKYLLPVRESLIKDGVVLLKEGEYAFAEDYLMGSPSAASSLITGMSTNGWDFWRNSENKSLKEKKREE